MSKFNKKLSQLEAMYEVASPVVKALPSTYVSDFIHHVFENQEQYNLECLSKQWFVDYTARSSQGSFKFVDGILQENGHYISRRSILEGIDQFATEIIDHEL